MINILLTNKLEVDIPELVDYIHIDMIHKPEARASYVADANDFWSDIDDGEVNNLYSYHTLDSMDYESSVLHLTDLFKKTAIGGTLTIVGYELDLLLYNIRNKTTSLQDFNKILSYINSITSIQQLLSLVTKNFKIVKKSVENNRYYLTLVREG